MKYPKSLFISFTVWEFIFFNFCNRDNLDFCSRNHYGNYDKGIKVRYCKLVVRLHKILHIFNHIITYSECLVCNRTVSQISYLWVKSKQRSKVTKSYQWCHINFTFSFFYLGYRCESELKWCVIVCLKLKFKKNVNNVKKINFPFLSFLFVWNPHKHIKEQIFARGRG